MTSALPAGVVSFLFTDIEGSTAAWDADPAAMRAALEHHDAILLGIVEDHSGLPVKARGEGDSWFVVFTSASDAVEAAGVAQRALADTEWPTADPIAVRMAVHTGSADLRDGDYYGPTVNRAARLRGIAHGGQTVLSGSTYELVQDRLPETMTLKDLGEHSLRDLERPERVYQLDVEGLGDSFAPLRSTSAIANNLPAQLTEFIGREAELAAAETSLETTRFLTILAAGGTGKSRLAIEVATNVAPEYPDGVFFVPLADIATGSDILQATAEVIGLSLSSDDDPKEQILRYLAAKRQLLIFDNFEHVKSEAALVTDILTAAPNITVIATSRTRLGLTGETVMNLSGLATSWSSPEEARSVEAVEL
ncbi:MAG: ATP-binding protein, partial [Acidimicrobiia bacterium]